MTRDWSCELDHLLETQDDIEKEMAADNKMEKGILAPSSEGSFSGAFAQNYRASSFTNLRSGETNKRLNTEVCASEDLTVSNRGPNKRFRPNSPCSLESSVEFVHNPTLLKRIPLNGDYLSVTFTDGTRYYLKMTDTLTEFPTHFERYEASGLIEEAEHILKSRFESQLTPQFGLTEASYGSKELWTTKYAPKRYTDLISNEALNRALLRWLKSWDSCVFGSGSADRPTASYNKANANFRTAAQSMDWCEDLERMASEIDPRDGLPRYRVVLLSGCPGLGKTTVAHLLAQHAGYQVVEVNASDDRTVSSFRDQLAAIVSSTSSLNIASGDPPGQMSSFKPCCLVLDEIDGAVPGAVELLAAAASTTIRPSTERRARSKRTSPLVLRRPVICICNDLYSSSVRPLRAPGVPCLVLRFPNVELGRLVARLNWIAFQENFVVDKLLLMHLAEVCDRDIRSCLNAMQFLSSQLARDSSSCEPKKLYLEDTSALVGLAGGIKDMQRSLFEVWKAVFTIPAPRLLTGLMERRTRFRCGIQGNRVGQTSSGRSHSDGDASLSARLDYVLDMANAAGDMTTVAMGIFENYLNTRMKDASLNVARRASEWFIYHDRLFKRIHSHSDYSLLRHPSILPGWFHLALATPLGLSSAPGVGAKSLGIRWPSTHSEANAKQSQCNSVLDQLLTNQWSMAPSTLRTTREDAAVISTSSSFRFLPRRTFVLDVAPLAISLLSQISSNVRSLNAQLYSQQEKAHLKYFVDVMLNLGLDWSPQPNTETGEIDFQLEPPLDMVTHLGNTCSPMRCIPHAIKQLLHRELNLERVRRSARLLRWTETTPGDRLAPPVSEPLVKTGPIEPPAGTPAFSKKIMKDFFGRPVEEKSRLQKVETSAGTTVDHQSCLGQTIYYRFREGYSNAVRRPVTLKQFL
ncbi:unnamed protein product [Dicrocoelium dendriticum]|nr:unnamed protein product [Dicrocoelium dendriticum]